MWLLRAPMQVTIQSIIYRQLAYCGPFRSTQLHLSTTSKLRSVPTRKKPRPNAAFTTSTSSDLMSRVRVVTSESECAGIVTNIMRKGNPVAIDTEGINCPVLGLVQIKDCDGNIFLVRTGKNRKLFFEGKLKEMFESQEIVKVFHASTYDCSCIFKEGIKIWGIFDTAIAHKVIEYQRSGVSVVTSPVISLNNVCRHHNIPENPLKKFMRGKGPTLLSDNEWETCDPLPPDLIEYCAWDVEPLHELFDVQSALIDPDLEPVLSELCEVELLRSIDPELNKVRTRSRAQVEGFDVFLSGVPQHVTKAHLYGLVARHDGYKKVLFSASSRTAHIIAADRKAAVTLYKTLADPGGRNRQVLGEQAKVSLVQELRPEEVEANAFAYSDHLEKLTGDNYVVDTSVCAQLVDLLLRVRCPVVLDFQILASNTVVMELFVGSNPPLKFFLNYDTVTEGRLGHLFTSTEVDKVVARVDSAEIGAALKVVSSANFHPRKWFDVTNHFKVIDYWHYGQSLFMSEPQGIKEIMKKVGLTSSNKLEGLLMMYMHMKEFIPLELLEILDLKCQTEVDINANISISAAKESRKKLRQRLEDCMVHVECTSGRCSDIVQVLEAFLRSKNFDFARIYPLGRCALVEMVHPPEVFSVVKNLQASEVDGLVLTASRIDSKVIVDKKRIRHVDLDRLQNVISSTVTELQKSGFFKVLSVSRQVPDVETAPNKGSGEE